MTFNENDIAISALSCATIFYESLADGNAIIGDMHTAGIVELPIFNYLYI
jgi:hypothetical protein